MLDQAFEALKTYDWGSDLAAVKPIDEAIVASANDTAARSELETKLAAVLSSDASRDAKDVVCRRLMQIGTAASVPALAKCLGDENLSHMGRYALERIQAPEAGKALRDALSSVNGALKVGVIGSLGARKDADSVSQLEALLGDSDASVARAAAIALGDIQTVAAAKLLGSTKPGDETVKIAVIDGSLACAEAMLADGNKGEAMKLYKGLLASSSAKHVKLAVTRGMLACAGK